MQRGRRSRRHQAISNAISNRRTTEKEEHGITTGEEDVTTGGRQPITVGGGEENGRNFLGLALEQVG